MKKWKHVALVAMILGQVGVASPPVFAQETPSVDYAKLLKAQDQTFPSKSLKSQGKFELELKDQAGKILTHPSFSVESQHNFNQPFQGQLALTISQGSGSQNSLIFWLKDGKFYQQLLADQSVVRKGAKEEKQALNLIQGLDAFYSQLAKGQATWLSQAFSYKLEKGQIVLTLKDQVSAHQLYQSFMKDNPDLTKGLNHKMIENNLDQFLKGHPKLKLSFDAKSLRLSSVYLDTNLPIEWVSQALKVDSKALSKQGIGKVKTLRLNGQVAFSYDQALKIQPPVKAQPLSESVQPK
ncbi:hypothetical protein [Vaginisenegalia massiliensis]|uniref:hypothetical protein n=1 Tax=Vaginisenegalia massiliensis TaxID=2058294 RepID=UPI000F545B92|nr:hypothetical protein [Vaginisenegalia massiliensis]